MPKKIKLSIVQTNKYLLWRRGISFQKDKLNYAKMTMLMMLNEGKYEYKSEIAKELGFNRHTIGNWIKKYEEEGLNSLLVRNNKNNAKQVLTEQIKKGVIRNQNNSTLRIESYSTLIEWVWLKYNVRIKYSTMYKFAREVNKRANRTKGWNSRRVITINMYMDKFQG